MSHPYPTLKLKLAWVHWAPSLDQRMLRCIFYTPPGKSSSQDTSRLIPTHAKFLFVSSPFILVCFKVKLNIFAAHLLNIKRWKIITWTRRRKKASYSAFKIGPIVRSTQGGKSVQYTNSWNQGKVEYSYERPWIQKCRWIVPLLAKIILADQNKVLVWGGL